MARKVFKNDDLLRLIYGFGDPDHRTMMTHIRRDINGPILSKLPESYPSLKPGLTDFFRWNRCKCCTRHCHNRPKLWVESRHHVPWLFLDKRKVLLPECKNFGDCDCNCRREMRRICRIISFMTHMNTYQV